MFYKNPDTEFWSMNDDKISNEQLGMRDESYYVETPVKLKGALSKLMFPKAPNEMEEYGYAIIKVKTEEILEGELHPKARDYMGCISVKGNMQNLTFGETHEFTIILDEVDEKWGASYKINFIRSDFNFENEEQIKIFFTSFLSENQIDNLYKQFDKPLKILQDGDIESLKKVKGIGESTAMKILDKYESSLDYAQAYVELSKYNLTNDAIKKLCDKYGSPEVLVGVIRNNPYKLIEVDGYGFKKADNIAFGSGFEFDNIERVKAYIEYILDKYGENGYSYIASSQLLLLIEDGDDGDDGLGNIDMGIILSAVNELKEQGIIYNEEKGKIGLRKFYNLELKIAEELKRLLLADSNSIKEIDSEYIDRIRKTEKLQGWEFTDEQEDTIMSIVKEQVSIVIGKGGCVDADTEFFTGREWKRIADYKSNDNVLQFNTDRTAELVKPSSFIKIPCDTMWHMNNDSNSIDQVLSDEHRVIYQTSRGHLAEKPFSEIMKIQNSNRLGFLGRFLHSFDYGGKGIDLTDAEIRVMVAVFADGSYNKSEPHWANYYQCRFHLKKDRKKDRLKKICEDANIELLKRPSVADGYSDFYIITPNSRQKTFPTSWYNASRDQLQIILEEVMYWDGSFRVKGGKSFSTTIKSDADFVQFVASACGYSAIIGTLDRVGQDYLTSEKIYQRKSVEYEVCVAKNKNRTTSIAKDQRAKTEIHSTITEYKTIDGYKYCFTVDSGMLILRRNGRIFITGNSGKSSSVLGGINALGDITFAQCALSGKASARLSELTGLPSYTIHRLLGFNPKGASENGNVFMYNKDNQLRVDAVVLDEASMIGGSLFLSLLEAIPTGCKLIMIGDTSQLPAIGALNVFYDCIESGIIPASKLTKIHRQAQKSAVITETFKLSEGIQITDKNVDGIEIRGELLDLELDIHNNKRSTVNKIIYHFEEKLALCGDVMEVQVIVPMNSRGESSVHNLNVELQEIYNPYSDNKDEIEVRINKKQTAIFRVGDKLMNTKNNYSVDTNEERSETVAVFNGFIGELKEIRGKDLIIYFPLLLKEVVIPYSHWQGKFGVQHAYAGTCHKMQGSGFKYVIAAIDYSHYILLSREWVYTALSRTIKHCVLIAENSALHYAINHTETRTKQTYMVDMLKGESKT